MKNHKFEFLLALIFMASIAWAQPAEWRQGCSPSNPEMKTYVANSIMPIVGLQREQFERFLSEEDRREIAGIRTMLPSLRVQHREMRTRIHESNRPITAAQRQQLRDLRNQIEVLMDKVSNIAVKHEHELTRVLSMLRQEIGAKLDEKCPDRSERPRRLQGERRMRGEAHGAGRHQESNRFHFRRLLTPEGFLLFDHAGQKILPDDQSGNQNDPLRMSLFPNPAAQEVQVSVLLIERSVIEIKLLDGNGNVLFNVSENAEQGMFSKTIDVNTLNNGMYIVKVQTDNNSVAMRLIVKR